MDKLQIVKKCYCVDLNKIQDSWGYSEITVYAENSQKAKSALLNEVKWMGMKRSYTDDEVDYLTLPVKRNAIGDIVIFEGQEIKRWEVNEKIKEREFNAQLDLILNDKTVTHCHIRKGGRYYCDRHCGYTERLTKAGVYSKEEAIREARSCHGEVLAIPIDIPSHNKSIEAEIKDLQSRLIKQDA